MVVEFSRFAHWFSFHVFLVAAWAMATTKNLPNNFSVCLLKTRTKNLQNFPVEQTIVSFCITYPPGNWSHIPCFFRHSKKSFRLPKTKNLGNFAASQELDRTVGQLESVEHHWHGLKENSPRFVVLHLDIEGGWENFLPQKKPILKPLVSYSAFSLILAVFTRYPKLTSLEHFL